jgi:hypothetical protein
LLRENPGLSAACLRHLCLALGLAASSRLLAQQAEQTVSPADQSPRVPTVTSDGRGFNFGVTLSGVHDSYVGWYNVVTPAASYAFSPHYSADVSMSIYPYRLAPNSDDKLRFAGGDLGDLLLEGHAIFTPHFFRDIATASMTLPTGNRADGLGTGRVTFNFDNRLERYVGHTGFLIDIGGGDSSALANRLVTEDDEALGPLAQFQSGIVTWLSSSISLQSVVYEQLPIGDQKTYATVGRPPFPLVTVVTGHRVNEDNGFTSSLYVPLSSRTTLTSSYNRSLRLHLDTVSVGLTFSWKSSPFRRDDSLIDRAIREAESGKPVVPPPR